MPWPWELGEWLLDLPATATAGRKQYKKPFLKEDYLEDLRWNKSVLESMKVVDAAHKTFSIPPERWEKSHRNFYSAMLAGLEGEDD